MDRRTFLSGAGCGVAALLAGCVTGTPLDFDPRASDARTFDVDDGTPLSIHNRNGPVTVAGYEGDDVALAVEKSARRPETLDTAAVSATEADGALRIETEHDGSPGDDRATVSLAVDCPPGVPVREVRTTHAPVEVTGVRGDATVASRNGPVTVTDVAGAVSLSTTNGAVEASGVEAIEGVTTANAAVDVEVPALVGDAAIETSNGGVDAALAPDVDTDVTAETTNGAVRVADLAFSSPERSGTSFSGTLGEGTHELAVETTNATVALTALTN